MLSTEKLPTVFNQDDETDKLKDILEVSTTK